MKQNKGFVKISRSLTEWEWWDDHNTTRLFLYCLLQAAWKDSKWKGLEIKRGQFVTSLDKLSKRTGLSIQQVKTSLNHLISTNNLTSKSTPNFRILTVKNYDLYQQNNKQTNKQLTNKQQTTNKQLTTVEERKEKKEYKEGEEGGARARANTPPHTPDDDILFLGDYGNVRLSRSELEKFEKEYPPNLCGRTIARLSQYMAENGKTYQNHYAVLCRWAKEDADKIKPLMPGNSGEPTYDKSLWSDDLQDFDFDAAMRSLKHDDV